MGPQSPFRIHSRHLQIARAYFTPWPTRLWVILVIAFATFTLCMRSANYPAQFAILMLGGSLAAWAGPVIAAQAKEHFADARSHLTPGYRRPHLLVSAVIFLFATVGIASFTFYQFRRIPSDAPWWPGFQITLHGYLAAVLVPAVLLAWMAHTQSPIFIFGTMIAAAAAFVTPAQQVTFGVLGSEYPILSYGLLIAALAGLFLLGWRLAKLNEEMFEYHRIDPVQMRGRRMATGDRQLRRSAAVEAGGLSAYLRAAWRFDQPQPSVFAAGFFRRALHWRFVTSPARGNVILSIAVAVVLLMLYALIPDHEKGTKLGIFGAVGAGCGAILPVLMAATYWPNRWLNLGGESLLPSRSRAVFLREQMTAMAIDVLSLWFWFSLGVLADILIMEPRWLLLPQAIPLVLLSLAGQFWFFGLMIWVVRMRVGFLATFFAFMGELLITIIFLAWQLDAPKHQPMRTPSPLLSAAMATAGVILTLDAYRRWRLMDLD